MNRGPIRGQTQCRPDGQTGMLFPACSLTVTVGAWESASPPGRGRGGARLGGSAGMAGWAPRGILTPRRTWSES